MLMIVHSLAGNYSRSIMHWGSNVTYCYSKLPARDWRSGARL